MTRESVTADTLPFEDGDTNIDLHAFQEDIGYQYAAQVTKETITLTLIDDEGPRRLPADPEWTWDTHTTNPLVPAAHMRYTWDPENNKWEYHSVLLPTIEALRAAKATMEPLGAHSFPLTLRQGDDADGLFKNETMLEAMADGEFIISGQPSLYVHDALYHGLGLATLDSEAAKTLQATSQLALRHLKSSHYAGSLLASSIVDGYDFATYYYTRPDNRGCKQLQSGRSDALFATILEFAREHSNLPQHVWAELVQTVEDGPFTYNVKSHSVRRYPALVDYYRQVNELLVAISSERAS